MSSANPKLCCSDLAVGAEREAIVVENLTRTQIVQYAGASGDFNPIHSDEIFATRAAGYPSVFAHGMLSMGLTGRLLTDWLGDGVLRCYGVRFVRQVWPGDTLTARGTVTAIETGADEGTVEIEIVTRNQKGEPVVTGTARAVLPARRPQGGRRRASADAQRGDAERRPEPERERSASARPG